MISAADLQPCGQGADGSWPIAPSGQSFRMAYALLDLTMKFLRRITADAGTVRAIGTVVSQGVLQKWIKHRGRLGRVSRPSSLESEPVGLTGVPHAVR